MQHRADSRHVAAGEQCHRLLHAPVLGDHVPGPAAQHRIGQPGDRGEAGDVPQRSDAEQGSRPVTFAAPLGVAAVAQVSPGNVASLRAFLAAGYRPIGSEVLFLPL